MNTRERIDTDLKNAMRARDKQRVDVLRLVTAAIKQVEIDERISVDEERLIGILTRLCKQRQESIRQFEAAHRDDLVKQEQFELELIQTWLPKQLDDAELGTMIEKAIKDTNAVSMADMGKVMEILKPALHGRADMGKVSALVKAIIHQQNI